MMLNMKRIDSEAARQAVDRIVIVPHNCHYNQNGWRLKYDHRVMCKKYTTPSPCPPMVCGVVKRHLEMAQPTKNMKRIEGM